MEFLLYGAYGYTGNLITEMAARQGIRLVLAGRNAEKLQALARKYDFPYCVLDLQDTERLDTELNKYPLVLHAAGPFRYTARPMLEACLRTGTHYLDITGEIEVFEWAAALDEQAREVGVMLMPGVGFDVVPTDCMAAYLKNTLPDADRLKLAFASVGGGVSHGTALTMVENLGKPGARRENGKIVPVPVGAHAMTVPFIEKDLLVMSIPWGDVSTAYYTTGIPNVETFMSVHPKTYKRMKYQKYLSWLLRMEWVRNMVRRRIDQGPAGPSAERREKAKSWVWGEVTNPAGERRAANLETLNGYTLTATTSLMIAGKVLRGEWTAGFRTPAGQYGPDLIMEVEGTRRQDL